MEKDIVKILKDFGYDPTLSDIDPNKLHKALVKHLGKRKVEDFYEMMETNSSNTEEDIFNYIGDDIDFLKILFSGQIKISISFLMAIATILKSKKLTPKNVLDLGCSDGWALTYLKQKVIPKSKFTGIDRSGIWKNKSKTIKIINSTYDDFRPKEKFDFVFSILGADYRNFEELIKCASENLDNEGHLFVGLRIGTEQMFLDFLDLASSYNLEFFPENSRRVHVNNESLPYLLFKKSKNKKIALSDNVKLGLLRQCFLEIPKTKKIYGTEAGHFKSLISSGKKISSSQQDWETGEWFKVTVFEKNAICYRVIENNSRDVLIEYPVAPDDPENDAEIQNNLASYNPDFWKSTL